MELVNAGRKGKAKHKSVLYGPTDLRPQVSCRASSGIDPCTFVNSCCPAEPSHPVYLEFAFSVRFMSMHAMQVARCK